MDRIGNLGGAPTIVLSNGHLGFEDENLSVGVEGTNVTAAWLSQVQETLMGVIEGAGLTADPANLNQLLPAIEELITNSRTFSWVQILNASGNIVVSATAGPYAFLLVQGGGGGGGGANGGAGGGGEGGAFVFNILYVTPGQVIPAVVGAGGAGGSSAYNGATGGTSACAGCTATGGAGGGAGASGGGSRYVVPNAYASGGILNINGATSTVGNAVNTGYLSGNGGGSFFGSGAPGVGGLAGGGFTGDHGIAPGTGGSGGTDYAAGGVAAGGLVMMVG